MATLHHFIIRSEVIKLYRSFVRVAYKAPADLRGELMEQIRGQFEMNRNVEPLTSRKYLLSDGRNQLNSLKQMVGVP